MPSKEYPHLTATDKIGVKPGPFVSLFDQLDRPPRAKGWPNPDCPYCHPTETPRSDA